MRIEHLFSKLESKTSTIFARIHSAVANGVDYIEILEKNIHTLFKFMNVSLRRSQWYRDELKSPYRENDSFLQHLFEASRVLSRANYLSDRSSPEVETEAASLLLHTNVGGVMTEDKTMSLGTTAAIPPSLYLLSGPYEP
jgi:uncharacterized protein DUF4238